MRLKLVRPRLHPCIQVPPIYASIVSSTDSEPLRTSGQAWKGKSRAHSSTAPTVISNVIDLTSDSPGESAVDSPVKQVLMANRTKASQHSSHLRTNNPKGAPFMVSPFSHNRSCSNAHNLHQPSSKCNTRSSGGSFSTPHLDSLLNKSSLCNQTQPPQSIPSSTPSPNSVFLPSPTSGGSSAPTSPFTSPAPEVVKSVQSATAASKVFNLKTLIQDMRASGKLNPPPKSLWEEIVEARTSDAENPTPSTSSHHSKPIEIDVDDINMINDTTELRNVHNRFSDRVASSDIPMDIDVEDNQKDSSVKSRANHKRFVRLGGLPPRRQPHDTMTTVKVEEEIPRILPSGTHSRRGRKMFEAKKLGPKARKRRQGDLLVIC